MLGGALAEAEAEFEAGPKVRGPMVADGNNERASAIVLYLQASFSDIPGHIVNVTSRGFKLFKLEVCRIKFSAKI